MPMRDAGVELPVLLLTAKQNVGSARWWKTSKNGLICVTPFGLLPSMAKDIITDAGGPLIGACLLF